MWTPDVLQSKASPFNDKVWRLVELQSKSVTMRLTDTLDEQALLEDIIEETKPRFPPACDGLHFLLCTPFRYEPYEHGSRFRRAHQRDGVYYCALQEHTAVAESAFYTLLFFVESPQTSLPAQGVERTAFQAAIKAGKAIDLTNALFKRKAAQWTNLSDYSACQDLADIAREAAVEAILYQSVRDPEQGLNVALLTPSAFSSKKPLAASTRTWRFHITRESVRALREFPQETIEFPKELWADDPRLQNIN